MKNRLLGVCAGVIILISSGLPGYSQGDVDILFKEGVHDGSYLIKGYVGPFMRSFGQGLCQGWYNTARPHKVAGFDITVTTAAMKIPASEKFFYVDNTKLSALDRISGAGGTTESGKVPTMFGPDEETWYKTRDSGDEFQGPPGLDIEKQIGKNVMVVPMATIGVGLPKGTDLKLRIVPALNLGDGGKFSLFGLGVMHDVKQHIPRLRTLPFDIAAFTGFTRIKLNQGLGGQVAGSGQHAVFTGTATTIQGIASRKFSVLTLYAGLGYNIAVARVGMDGWYDFDGNNVKDMGETNPLDLKFGASGPRTTLGFRLKLAILTIHADYTLQRYQSLTVGVGFSVR